MFNLPKDELLYSTTLKVTYLNSNQFRTKLLT